MIVGTVLTLSITFSTGTILSSTTLMIWGWLIKWLTILSTSLIRSWNKTFGTSI